MHQDIYDCGLEEWEAYYFNTNSSVLVDDNLINQLGETLEVHFKNPAYLKQLCDDIKEMFHNKDIIDINRTCACFANYNVEYIKDKKYLKFPDFIIPELNNHVLRIDINPCLARTQAMTKIYCIQRIARHISQTQALDIYKKSKGILEAIIKLVAKKYVAVFNSFLTDKNIQGIDSLDESSVNSPVRIVYRVLGASDDETIQYIEKANARKHKIAEFSEFRSTSDRAKSITNALKEIIKIENNNWSTSDFAWHSPSVSSEELETVHGYIGAKKDNNLYYFVGIADSIPKHLLLPLNLQSINSN